MNFRKIICAVLTVILMCGMCFAPAVSADEPDAQATTSASAEEVLSGFAANANMVESQANNDKYSLWIDLTTAALCLVDKQTGATWWTNPTDPESENPDASVTLKEMQSQFILSYYDKDDIQRTINSYQCINDSSLSIAYAENGFKSVYNFTKESQQFSLTLLYQLTDDGLKVTIPADGIQENGTSKIYQITLLPYLISGDKTDDGYLIIPNGSGSLIRFEDEMPDATVFQQYVYGKDNALSQLYKMGDESVIRIPVLATVRNGNSLLAVIDGNESVAAITAIPSAKYSDIAYAAPVFTIHQMDIAIITGMSWQYNEYTVLAEDRTAYDCSVTYYPLSGADDYSDVAAAYREMLVEDNSLEPLSEALNGTLDFYGQGWEDTTFLGIPIKKNVTATKLSDVEDILKEYSDAGIDDLTVKLTAFGKESYQRKLLNKVKVDGNLGGLKGLKSVIKNLDDSYDLYWNQDVVSLYNINLFKKVKAVDGLNHIEIEVAEYLPSTLTRDVNGQFWWYTAPSLVLKNVKTLTKSLKADCGLSLDMMGAYLYGDFNDSRYVERQTALGYWQEAFDSVEQDLLLTGGNLYAALTADVLVGVENSGAMYDCVSETVPFYSLVFTGYVKMSSEALNAETDLRDALLECIEYGIAPTFQMTAEPNRELRETSLDNLINTCYDYIKDDTLSVFTEYSSFAKEVVGCYIVSHSNENGLVRIEYSNGKVLLMNRSAADAAIDGATVKAGSWCFK